MPIAPLPQCSHGPQAKQCPLHNSCQGPALVCSSESDMQKNITVPCGTWTTYYLQSNYNNAQSYCAGLGSGGVAAGGGGNVTSYSGSQAGR